MEYEAFLTKINGKEKKDESIDSASSTLGAQQYESIIRTARNYGWRLNGLEERPEFPSGIEAAWRCGLQGDSLGLHGDDPIYWAFLMSIRAAGLRHSRSERQAGVPPEAEPTGQSTGATASDHIHWGTSLSGQPTVGSTSTDTQSGTEPIRIISNGDYVSVTFDLATGSVVRSSTRTEEGRVPSVRDEREGSQRGEEDTQQSLRRSLERLARW